MHLLKWNPSYLPVQNRPLVGFFQVMNLTKDVSMDEIRQRWRELSKVWHPDRFQDPREKDLAQIKFIEINEAYSVLSSKKMKRS